MKSSYSIGMDMVYIPEFESYLKDPGTAFFDQTFTDWEKQAANLKQTQQRATFYSGRYAAKEAFLKALDGRWLHTKPTIAFKYSELEIRNDDFGRPYFRYYGSLLKTISDLQMESVKLSITHVHEYAASQVLIEF
ncbi:holo-ACP synthase [Leptospira levettii]|uniref:holo-ACP synthase n=1 Tax=Leptospira levettii TaxID=2023178 RepID=UPI00223E291D|nr:holo-ACP synthase [Leptospira levettii]MCW7506436.1 holo-ACP synthase [Leptospira levettii]MCW7517526.1 holo-ACP synthase [Leptospira levettii]